MGARGTGRQTPGDPVAAGRLVVVDGTSRVARVLADLLRARGLTVHAGPYAADAALGGIRPPTLVVLAGDQPPGPTTARLWRARGIPHLAVVMDAGGGMVGPLVGVGGRPCLECLQLRGALVGASVRGAEEPALTSLTAALAAAVVLAALEGRAPSGVSLEVSWPWPRVIQRVWPAHPACSCRRVAAAVGG